MRKWLFLQSISLLAVLGGTAAQAQDDRHYNEFEITPFAGFMTGGEFEDPTDGSGRDLDDDTSFGVIFNAVAGNDYWRHYELLYAQQATQLQGVTTPDMDVQYLQVGGTVSDPDAERVIPYIGLSIGATRFSPDEVGLEDETKLSFSVAGGFKVPITDRIGVRFDARAFITLLDTNGSIFCVSSSGLTCRITAKSDTFLQYSANLGLIVGF